MIYSDHRWGKKGLYKQIEAGRSGLERRRVRGRNKKGKTDRKTREASEESEGKGWACWYIGRDGKWGLGSVLTSGAESWLLVRRTMCRLDKWVPFWTRPVEKSVYHRGTV